MTPTRRRPSDTPWLFRAAVLVAVAPIVVAALRNGLAGWLPTNDAALSTVRINDVFSAHPPLVGLPARNSFGPHQDYFYPGALHFYLLAIPVRVLGSSWGILCGMAVLNSAWLTVSLWLVRRRVGSALGIVACVFAASLVWGLGSQVLMDPTPVQTGPLAFLTLCVAAWSFVDRDPRSIVPLAVVGNYLVLTHLKYALVAPIIVAVSAATVVATAIARFRGDRSAWRRAFGERRRPLLWALVFTVVVWIPPIVQQFHDSQGNLSALADQIGAGGAHAHRNLVDTMRVVSSVGIHWPLWMRSSLAHPSFSTAGPISSASADLLGAAVVAVIAAFVFVSAWRRRDRTVLAGMGIGFTGWAGWVVSAQANPDTTAYQRTYLLSLWPLAMFFWMIISLGLIRALRRHPVRRPTRFTAAARVGAIVGTAAFAAASLPIANLGAATPDATIPLARKVRVAVKAHVPSGGPILVTAPGYPSRTYFPVAIFALQERHIDVKVSAVWDSTVYGSFRAFTDHPPNARRELIVTNDPRAPSGARTLLAIPAARYLTPTTFDRVASKVVAWLATAPKVAIDSHANVTPTERVTTDAALADAVDLAHRGAPPDQVIIRFAAAFRAIDPASIDNALRSPGIDDALWNRWLLDLVAEPTFLYYRPMPSG